MWFGIKTIIEEMKISLMISAAVEAGKKILEIYSKDFSVQHKADESPLTLADLNSHK